MAIPIAVCGRAAAIFDSITELLPATYEVVSGHMSAEAATSELTALLRGSKVVPSSGYGSNVTNEESKIPVVVVVGGAFPQEDFEQVVDACNSVRPLPFFRADNSKNPSTGGPPSAQELVDRVVKAMDEVATGKGAGAWEPGVYFY